MNNVFRVEFRFKRTQRMVEEVVADNYTKARELIEARYGKENVQVQNVICVR